MKGKAVRLLSGPKNSGLKKEDRFDPKQGKCNFAVPSFRVLRTIDDSNPIPKEIKPSIIQDVLNLSSTSKEYILAIDGKKVAQGLNDTAGDIDLWGYETPKKDDKQTRLNNNVAMCNDIRDEYIQLDRTDVLNNVVGVGPHIKAQLVSLATATSSHIKDLRELHFQQQKLRDKLQRLEEQNPDNKVTHLSVHQSRLVIRMYTLGIL